MVGHTRWIEIERAMYCAHQWPPIGVHNRRAGGPLRLCNHGYQIALKPDIQTCKEIPAHLVITTRSIGVEADAVADQWWGFVRNVIDASAEFNRIGQRIRA